MSFYDGRMAIDEEGWARELRAAITTQNVLKPLTPDRCSELQALTGARTTEQLHRYIRYIVEHFGDSLPEHPSKDIRQKWADAQAACAWLQIEPWNISDRVWTDFLASWVAGFGPPERESLMIRHAWAMNTRTFARRRENWGTKRTPQFLEWGSHRRGQEVGVRQELADALISVLRDSQAESEETGVGETSPTAGEVLEDLRRVREHPALRYSACIGTKYLPEVPSVADAVGADPVGRAYELLRCLVTNESHELLTPYIQRLLRAALNSAQNHKPPHTSFDGRIGHIAASVLAEQADPRSEVECAFFELSHIIASLPKSPCNGLPQTEQLAARVIAQDGIAKRAVLFIHGNWRFYETHEDPNERYFWDEFTMLLTSPGRARRFASTIVDGNPKLGGIRQLFPIEYNRKMAQYIFNRILDKEYESWVKNVGRNELLLDGPYARQCAHFLDGYDGQVMSRLYQRHEHGMSPEKLLHPECRMQTRVTRGSKWSLVQAFEETINFVLRIAVSLELSNDWNRLRDSEKIKVNTSILTD